MKTALVFSLRDNKLLPESYSQVFRSMLRALSRELSPQIINESCHINDIDADAVIFFDPHSTHLIKIDGIEDSSVLKYEFMDDPHQIEMFGLHKTTGIKFQKLGAGGRIRRALTRGIDYIICPHKESYYKYFGPYLNDKSEDMLVWFPCAPDQKYFTNRSLPLRNRRPEILANGATWAFETYHPYRFRYWAFQQPEVTFIPHYIKDQNVPSGILYPRFLAGYAGALALCEAHVCPKHMEIPLAGCLCFVQKIDEYMELGFEDQKNCITINQENFSERLNHFLKNPSAYQDIADAGRRLVEENYTASHFAGFIRRHIERNLKQKERTRILSPVG